MSSAPTLDVVRREVVAVEHPMVVKNLDEALKTFGVGSETTGRPFRRLVDLADPDACIPLYLRHDDPVCTPVLSHNSSSNNVLLQITVPKRTGRKRKRGSQDPYLEDPSVAMPAVTDQEQVGSTSTVSPAPDLQSHSRFDNARELLRSLKDNVERYKVEAVAEIDRTHRFRGLVDFHHSTANTEFVPKLKKLVYPKDIAQMRQFKFNPSKGWKPNEEFVPQPLLTNHVLPFNWGWHQNPNIIQTIDKTTGKTGLLNRSQSRKFEIEYLSHDAEDTPTGPPPDTPDDPELVSLISELKEALEERPLWTRRALSNRIGKSSSVYLLKSALQYVGYQFKGGPFRDAVIKFGIDPRSDPKYRMYQTVFFKLYEEDEKGPFRQWKDNRSIHIPKRVKPTDLTTHLFDGKSLTLDGKVWQLCDITDPYLSNIIQNAPVCTDFNNVVAGFFYNGSWAKIRAVMKLKLTAIRLGKIVEDSEFEKIIHRIPDIVENNQKPSSRIAVPVPDIKLTEEERQKLLVSGIGGIGGSKWKTDQNGNAKKLRPRNQRVEERNSKARYRDDDSSTPGLLRQSIERSNLFSSTPGTSGRGRQRIGTQEQEFGDYAGADGDGFGLDDEADPDAESDLEDYGSLEEDDENESGPD